MTNRTFSFVSFATSLGVLLLIGVNFWLYSQLPGQRPQPSYQGGNVSLVLPDLDAIVLPPASAEMAGSYLRSEYLRTRSPITVLTTKIPPACEALAMGRRYLHFDEGRWWEAMRIDEHMCGQQEAMLDSDITWSATVICQNKPGDPWFWGRADGMCHAEDRWMLVYPQPSSERQRASKAVSSGLQAHTNHTRETGKKE